jgi:hypothetical protein
MKPNSEYIVLCVIFLKRINYESYLYNLHLPALLHMYFAGIPDIDSLEKRGRGLSLVALLTFLRITMEQVQVKNTSLSCCRSPPPLRLTQVNPPRATQRTERYKREGTEVAMAVLAGGCRMEPNPAIVRNVAFFTHSCFMGKSITKYAHYSFPVRQSLHLSACM